jgi:hypothetical protein
MTTLDRQQDIDAGSRMHLLDWLESERFLPELRVSLCMSALPSHTTRRVSLKVVTIPANPF